MELTRTERWILYNQYRIIELLTDDEHEENRAREAQTVLKDGYTTLYRTYCPAYDDGVSEDLCREVFDILNLFRIMKFSNTGVDPKRLRFPGFDGNDETELKCLSFAKFFCDELEEKRYPEIERPDDFNSHMPMLDAYRAMLAEWRRMRSPGLNLTKEQVERILEAGGL